VACEILAASATQDTRIMKIYSVGNFFKGALSSDNIDYDVSLEIFYIPLST
jgi:hypothetical protein